MDTNPQPEHSADVPDSVVDFSRLGRRLGRTAAVLGALVVVGWVASIAVNGADLGLLMNLFGLGLGLMFVAEVVIVGGSALRGMLRAGQRGDRLASSGVGILPPQLSRGAEPRRRS
ncbi:MAG: hypothetical protein ACI867_000559 [Glaciecola sp.]|jgi:hypothetical protein